MDITGVLFFPITPFDSGGDVDSGVLREHVQTRREAAVGAIFAACGTGEFHALSAPEVGQVVATVAGALDRPLPVIAGVGGPLGHARACARAAADAGAVALLAMPPYLVPSEQSGLADYFESIAAATDLPVIVYHRPGAVLQADTVRRLLNHANIVGIKDGLGDVALMTDILTARRAAGRNDFAVLNGMPCAEVHDPTYRRAGISVYSSSTFVMAPRVALAYRDATEAGDEPTRQMLLEEFFVPLDQLRRRRLGYNVTLIKGGVRLGGLPVGPVRPPLSEIEPADLDDLRRLLAHADDMIAP